MSVETITQEETKTRTCPMYKVIMHNDDVTSMEFVIMVLHAIYNKELNDAVNIMLEIHNTGSGLAGVYSYEQAEFRVDQTHSLARAQKFPLTCTIEPA
jgi:ATP-dependent Clp protease adaptor protein ClpS